MDKYQPLKEHPYGNYFPKNLLEVFESPYPKKRIGKDGDGGYIIVELPEEMDDYDLLLGCGIADDLSFEYQLLEKYPALTADVFDGSIPKLPNNYDKHPRIRFHCQFIGEDPFDINKRTVLSPIEEITFESNSKPRPAKSSRHITKIKNGRIKYRKARLRELEPVATGAQPIDLKKLLKQLKTIEYFPRTTNLREYLESHNNIFLKMDIEGSEFDWFNSLTLDEIKKFKQIVIELHKPFYPERHTTLENLRKTHYIVHLTGNNVFPPVKIGDQIYPKFIEATFLRKDLFPKIPQLSKQPIPSSIDKKNRHKKPWIVLEGYPYN